MEYKDAKSLALRSLGRKGYYSQELASKLVKKGVSKELATEVVAECVEKSFLNDQEMVEGEIRSAILKHKGPLWVAQKLRLKGLPLDQIKDILHNHYPSNLRKEVVDEIIQKKSGLPKEKIIRSILQAGFSFADISTKSWNMGDEAY